VLIASDGAITDLVIDDGRRVAVGDAVEVAVDPARVDAA
jgi:hypothetical protein